MADCHHRYRADREACPHPAADDSDLCPWHNPIVDKSAAYVGESLTNLIKHHADADLEECHLIGIDWQHAQLANANLKGCDLRDSSLRGANLSGADLRGAQLRRTNLQNANLKGADLSGADLTDAHLGNTDLSQAILRDTLIEGTILNSTDLRESDLTGAVIESFYWNRLTRFSGIRGLEPRKDSNDATQRYVAPFALGDHDISASRRSSLSESEPDLVRTRFYRSSQVQRPPLPTAAESKQSPAVVLDRDPHAGPESHVGTNDHRVALYRKQNRQLLVIVFLSVVIAVTAVGLALTGQLSSQNPDDQRLVDRTPQPPTGIYTTPTDNPDPTTTGESADFYREQIASLSNELDQSQRQASSLSTQANGYMQRIQDLESTLRGLNVDNARLQAKADEAAMLSRERERMQHRITNLLAVNSRLERTATILSSGMGEVQSELERLQRLTTEEQTNLALLKSLEEQVTELQTKLAANEQQLAQARESNISLEFDLEQARQVMDTLVRRIQGTPLEVLLGEVEDQATEVALQPNVPVVLGGDVLLTLTVAQESHGRLRCAIVLQGAHDESLPEISLILQDRTGAPLHKLGFTFPDNPEQPGFASAITIVESHVFPASARLIATPNLEQLLNQQQ